MLETVKAIDIHTHINHGSPFDTSMAGREESYNCTLDFLLREYDACNIACGAFSTFAGVISDRVVCAENDYMYALSKENPRVYQWVVIEPRQDDTFLQADKMLSSEKCLGIKIHPGAHGYDIRAYGDKIFGYANEKEAAVVMHPQCLDSLAELADKYPKMKLIIAHVYGKGHVDAALGAKHKNIYVDTSGSGSFSNNIIEYATEKLGSEKILFGTDTYSSASQYGRIVYARISEKDKVNILRDNALRLFPQKLEPYKV